MWCGRCREWVGHGGPRFFTLCSRSVEVDTMVVQSVASGWAQLKCMAGRGLSSGTITAIAEVLLRRPGLLLLDL